MTDGRPAEGGPTSPTTVKAPHDQMNLPGAYIVNCRLFFRLRDGSVVTCNCIAEPYASQVKDACDAYRIY